MCAQSDRVIVKASWAICTGVVLLIAGGFCWLRWKEGEPRRCALQIVGRLEAALRTGNSADLLGTVCLPAAVQGRTAPEQAEFLRKALQDEISAEGLVVLGRDGEFGPLPTLYPTEAKRWADQAGVNPEDCIAFKLERNGLRAEVVLARPSTLDSQPATGFRVLRCNNVKQLAPANQP